MTIGHKNKIKHEVIRKIYNKEIIKKNSYFDSKATSVSDRSHQEPIRKEFNKIIKFDCFYLVTDNIKRE